MRIEIDDSRINEIQRDSIERLFKHVKGAHMVDVIVRKNGQDYHFEGDWMWHARVTHEEAA